MSLRKWWNRWVDPRFTRPRQRRTRSPKRALLHVERLEDRVTPSTLIPVTTHRDLVFDASRGLLYITTSGGTVERWSVANQSLLTGLSVGTSLNGADITPSGSDLYVAENQAATTTGTVYDVALATGTVTPLTYTLAFGEGGAWDVAIASNGKALLTTEFAGSGWVPLRQINLSINAITTRTDDPGSGGNGKVETDSFLSRAADGSLMVLTESNISTGPFFSYTAGTDHFSASATSAMFIGMSAVNRNGSLIAVEMANGSHSVSIVDKNFHVVHDISNADSGVAFDPLQDILYVANSASDQVIAYDTNTWNEKYALPIGEAVSGANPLGNGRMIVSNDGKYLFLGTASGVREFILPTSTGVASSLAFTGLSSFIATGVAGTLTVSAVDPAGNVATSYTGTVQFSSSDGAAQFVDPATGLALSGNNYTFQASDQGVKALTVTFNTAGTQSVSATDSGNSLSVTQTGINVHSGAVSLIPVVNRSGLVYDPTRNILDITTTDGTLERFDIASQSLLSPWSIGNRLEGADITSDGSQLYVAEGQRGVTQGLIRDVNLNTGAVTNLHYNLTTLEAGAFSVAITNNNKAFFTTEFEGSGVVPYRQIDLATNVISVRNDTPGVDITQNDLLARSADGSRTFLTESNVSNGPLFSYAASTDSFSAQQTSDTFLGNALSAVNRNGTLIAMELPNGSNIVSVLDANLHVVHDISNADGGVAFDPVRDLLYVASTATNEVLAYDTNTWQQMFALPIGETIGPSQGMGNGVMAVSSDSKYLFLATASGIRVLHLPAPTGIAASLTLNGFSNFVSTGVAGTLTVTAVDPAGNVATGYTGTVQLSSTDAAALFLDPATNLLVPGNSYTFGAADQGVKTFIVILNTVGTQSITARDSANGLSVTQANVNVHAPAVTLIPLVKRSDLVYDATRNVLDITQSDGTLQRYDVGSESLLAPLSVGNRLLGADITTDGASLYVAEGDRGTTQGLVHVVNLTTGAVSDLRYDRILAEGGAWAVVVNGNGKAFFDGQYEGSGWTPLRQIDLSTGAISPRTDDPGSGPYGWVRQNTFIARGADRSLDYYAESNISSGPTFTYNAGTDSFPSQLNTNGFIGNDDAVNRNGSLVALSTGTTAILDASLHVLGSLPSIDGGMVFDPVHDIVYGADSATDQIVAFNTNTLTQLFTIPIGEPISTVRAFNGGMMAVSSDGNFLFFSTPSGVRVYPLNGLTATSATLSASPSGFGLVGQPVTLTANIAGGNVASRAGESVTFLDGATVLGTGTLDAAGNASITTSALGLGTHALTAKYAGDSAYLGSAASISYAIDQGPTITSASSTTFTVGTPGNFQVTDSGTPPPTLSISGDTLPSGVTFSTSTGLLSGTPAPGTGRIYHLVFTVQNSLGTATQNFTLTVGEAPTFTSGVSTTFTTGVSGTFTFAASGFPTPTFTQTGDTLPSGVTFDGNTGILSGTPAAGTGGVYHLVFTAQNNFLPDATQNFTLTVNEAPAFTSLDNTTFAAGSAGTFTVKATGYPAVLLSYTGALPGGVSFDAQTGILSGTPAALSGAQYPIVFTAHNGVGGDAQQNFTLTVLEPPTITSNPATTFVVGNNGSFKVVAAGFPGSTFTQTGDTLPSGVSFDGMTGVLSGTPAAGTVGTYNLVFTAHNGIGSDATQSFTLTVKQTAAITSPAATTFTVGQFGSFPVTVSGSPVPTVSQSGDTLPAGVTFDPNTNLLSGTPQTDTGGVYHLVFTAHNGVGGDATQSFTLTVNEAPAITSLNNTAFVVGQPGTFLVMVTGFPAPTLSESGDTLPAGVTFNAGTLSGTPAAGTAGVYHLTFTAHNGVGSDAAQSFTLNVNAAPSITSAAQTTFIVGQPGSFTVTAIGTPPPTFAQFGDTLPSGVTLDANSGVLSGTPAAGTLGIYHLIFTAHNGVGVDAQQNFTLTVGQPPAITSLPTTTFVVGTTGNFAVTATGFPTPSLSEAGDPLPSNVTFTPSTGVVNGLPAVGTGGLYHLVFTASNGVGSDATQSFTLVVNESAAITSVDHITFRTGEMDSFTVTTRGYPVPTLSQSGDTLPSGVTFDPQTGVLSGAASVNGTYHLIFTAHNGIGSDSVQNFTLTVNDTPHITSADNFAFVAGQPGRFTVTATGTPTPALTEIGLLPPGIQFHPATGVLSGTPALSAGGVYPITFRAHNGIGPDDVQSFTLAVDFPPTFTSTNNARFVVGSPGFFQVAATGLPAPTFSASGDPLPMGITLDPNTGAVSGTPASGTGGVYHVVLTAGNSIGTVAQNFTLNVDEAPAITSTDNTTFVVGANGSFKFSTTGSPAPTLSLTSGSLPLGVYFVSVTNHVFGTPAPGTGGEYHLTFTAHNGVAPDATQSFTLVVDESPTLTSAPIASFSVGLAGSFAVHATGNPAPTFAISGPPLPAGLTLNPMTGVLSGTPAPGTEGTYTVVITANNGIGASAAQSVSLEIFPPGFVYYPDTELLTVTGTGPQNAFSYAQATVDVAGHLKSTYTFGLNGFSVSLTDAQVKNVTFNGPAGTFNTGMLLTNDTYTAPGGQTLETTEAVTVGNGGGRVQTFDPKGNVQDFVTLSGFQTVYAVAGSADEGFIAGTPGIANVFVGAGNYAYMNSGPAFYYLAGAKYVYSYALSGADFAYEYDGSGPSAYVASGTAYAMMLGTDHGRSFFNEGVGFTATEGIASHPNQDVAYFYDSPGSDTFTGYAQYASLTSAGQNDAAVYFAQIYAYSFVGGTDVAYNYAPAVNHVYYLDPTTGYGFRRGV